MLGAIATDSLNKLLEDSHIDPNDFLRRQQLQPNPLLTPELSSQKIAIFNPAVNSSGDIYHIAAYLMLCQHFHWEMPTVYIGSDTDKTLAQARRGKALLDLLGFGDRCEIISYKSSSHQASPRSAEMRTQLKAKNIKALDQKMSTALLAMAYFLYGEKIIKPILYRGFVASPWARINKKFGKNFHGWLKQKVEKISAFVENRPFVVLHDRHSDTANSGQTLSDTARHTLTNYLKSKGIRVFVILVTDVYITTQKDSTGVFEPVTGLDPQYDKFRHIQLLHAISCMNNFLGVIGGTSGTLDLVAFLGIRVFNIHNFNDKSYDPTQLIPYQDFRILLQTQFMTVCRSAGPNGLDSVALSFLYNWITQAVNYRFPLFPAQRNACDKAHCDDHNDRVPFKYCLLPQKPIGATYEWHVIKRVDNLYVVAANKFFNLQKAWVDYSIVQFTQLRHKTKAFTDNAERSLCARKYPKDDSELTPAPSTHLEPQRYFEAHF